MENKRSIQSANFELQNSYFGIDVLHNYDGIYATAYMSETLATQQVYGKHQRFLQLDKSLSYTMVVYVYIDLHTSNVQAV